MHSAKIVTLPTTQDQPAYVWHHRGHEHAGGNTVVPHVKLPKTLHVDGWPLADYHVSVTSSQPCAVSVVNKDKYGFDVVLTSLDATPQRRASAAIAINGSLWSSDQAGIATEREPTGNDPFTRNNAIAPLPAASSPPRRAEHPVRRLFPGLPCEINRPKVANPSQASPRATAPINLTAIYGPQKSGGTGLKMDFGGYFQAELGTEGALFEYAVIPDRLSPVPVSLDVFGCSSYAYAASKNEQPLP